MKNSIKKLVSILLAAGMVVSFAAGCGSSNDVNTTNGENNAQQSVKHEKIEFPIKDDVTLSAFVSTRPSVDDYNNNKMTQMITEKTGIKLKFDVVNESDAQTKLNTLLSTGDYPDMIWVSALTLDLQSLYGSQGALIPLNDYIDSVGENTQKMFSETPEAKEVYTMSDGKIYNLPGTAGAFHMQSNEKYWIYKPWLDKLGLSLPKTTDEFENVLKAFKEQDPNGNGLADEIPLSGCRKGWNAEVESFLMNAFTYTAYNQNGRWLQIKDGKVVASYMTDEWKDGLKYLHKLNSEGLLDSEAFTLDSAGLKRLGENPDTVILGCFPGGSSSTACNMSGDRWRYYEAVEPLKGPNGVSLAYYEPQYEVGGAGASITDHCKNPDEAFALLDYMYSQEISLDNTSGMKGDMWDDLPDNTTEKGIDGKKATWKLLKPVSDAEQNSFWNQMGNRYESVALSLQRANDDVNDIEHVLYNETNDKYLSHVPDKSVPMPKLVLSSDQSNDLLTYTTTINNYAEEYLVDCIIGSKDIDATWDSYISQLKSQGVEEMLKIYQSGYEDKYKK